MEMISRPIGPLLAWQWGIVLIGGYLGYRVLSGKGLTSGGSGSSSSGTPVGSTNATGGITQGPQGDPGPIGLPGLTGPAGPPGAGPIGTGTGTTIGTGLTFLSAHQWHLWRTDKPAFLKSLSAHQLHVYNKGGGIKAFAPTPLVASSILAPSTTSANQLPSAAGPATSGLATAVSIDKGNIPSSTLPVRSTTAAIS